MSIGKSGLGIPAVLLHDAEGFPIIVETKIGEMYRGMLTARELLSHAPVFRRIERFRESKGKYVPS